MWTVSTAARYSGNDTVEGENVMIMIFDSVSVSYSGAAPIGGIHFDSITFSNGNASKTWAEGTDNNNGSEEDNVITIGNWTYQANADSGDGTGTSTITMMQDNDKLTFSGTLNEGYEWGPFCNILITPNDTELAKLKTATSISFKVKGDGATYQLQLPTPSDITDYSYYSTTFTAYTTETTVTINISDLTGPGWGQSLTTPFDQSNVSSVVIQTRSTAVGSNFNLTISDFRLDND